MSALREIEKTASWRSFQNFSLSVGYSASDAGFFLLWDHVNFWITDHTSFPHGVAKLRAG